MKKINYKFAMKIINYKFAYFLVAFVLIEVFILKMDYIKYHSLIMTNAQENHKKLNNLVTELLHLKSILITKNNQNKIEFINPRDGWVYIKYEGTFASEKNGKIELFIDGSKQSSNPILVYYLSDNLEAGFAVQEAMQFLLAGKYKIRIQIDNFDEFQQAKLESLIIRAIPQLIYCKFQYNPHITPYGPYDWEFMKKYINPHINTIIGSNSKEHQSYIEEWKKQGKKWLTEIHAAPYFQDMSVDEAYQFWTESEGFKNPLVDGVIVDEFGGGDSPRYATVTESVQRISQQEKFKEKSFNPYCFGMYSAEPSKKFIQTIINSGYWFAVEHYFREQPKEYMAKEYLKTLLTEDMNLWRKEIPNSEKHMVICLGYLSMITTESLNSYPEVDYKVWMDIQFQFLATNPAFSEISGLMEYTSGYADEETVRWAARLYRHYGIDGNTELLSNKYGFKYQLQHIDNPDFENDLKGWKTEPAEKWRRSLDVKSMPGYGWLQGRYPRTEKGDTFLWMKRNAKKPNIIKQTIRNLTIGKLYSLKMVTADYQELLNGKSIEQKHAVSVNIEGVELIPDKCFQFPIPNNYSHGIGKFDASNKAWMNYHYVLFRANGEKAQLSISDWASKSEPVGPIGQELMFNFIELQPYFEE